MLAILLALPLPVSSAHAQPVTLSQPLKQAVDLMRTAKPVGPSSTARTERLNVQLTQRQLDIFLFGDGAGEKSVYSYEQNRRVVEERFLRDALRGWQPETRIHFEWLEGNTRVPGLIEFWDDHAGMYVNAARRAYEYVVHIPSGIYVTGIVEQTSEGNGWVDVFRSTYTYGTCSNAWCPLLTATDEAFVDGSWHPVQRLLWEDTPGTGAVMVVQNREDGAWANVTRVIYEDALWLVQMTIADIDYLQEDSGELLLHAEAPDHRVQEWDGANWVDSYRMTSTITEEAGQRALYVALIDTYAPATEEWEPAIRVTKSYNQAGLPTSLVVEDLEEEEAFRLIERYTFGDGPQLLQEATISLALGDDEFVLMGYTFTWADVSVNLDAPAVPVAFTVEPVYPNPLNASATVPYRISEGSVVTARIFDMLGREVATLLDGYQPAGAHALTLDASRLSAGTYIIKMQVGDQNQVRRVVVQR